MPETLPFSNGMKIKNLSVQQIFDSRGEPTIEVGVLDGKNRWFFAQVPSGKSRGKNEAKVLNFRNAERVLKKQVKKAIIEKNYNSIRALDNSLLRLDPTKNKSRIGGNLTLGISVAFSRMLAAEKRKEIWQILRSEFFSNAKSLNKKPLIFSNLINGGLHANNNLNIQEYMVMARSAPSVAAAVKKLIDFYHNLGIFLKKERVARNIPIGDEGGYAINFKNNFEPIAILEKLIYKYRLQKKFLIGLDAAATNFYKGKKYLFDRKRFSAEHLADEYVRYFKNSKLLFSIEDPFAENDLKGFSLLRKKLPKALIIGDDLTTTNPAEIKRNASQNLINAVIIKPNQIGTVSETCEAIKIAKKYDLKTIISHRSGETEDNFIIHLARASSAYGVKIGAPARERLLKFDELTRIY
jgi:enolase